MSQHFGHTWVTKTRKPHCCGWCAKRIEPGSAAEYSSGVFQGDFWAHHVHPECAAARDSMTYHELEEGWCPGDFARGRVDDEYKLPPVFSPSYRGKLAAQRDQTEESASYSERAAGVALKPREHDGARSATVIETVAQREGARRPNDPSSPTGSAQEAVRTGEARPAPSQFGAAHGYAALLDASQKLREYLEGPKCIVPGFDVPDEIWQPFTQALDARPNEQGQPQPPETGVADTKSV